MIITYIEEVREFDHLIFQEKIHDFNKKVRYLHRNYIDNNFNLTVEEMVEKFEKETNKEAEDKKEFANFYNLEYEKMQGLEYLGVASVEFAKEYLEIIQMLPQKP